MRRSPGANRCAPYGSRDAPPDHSSVARSTGQAAADSVTGRRAKLAELIPAEDGYKRAVAEIATVLLGG